MLRPAFRALAFAAFAACLIHPAGAAPPASPSASTNPATPAPAKSAPAKPAPAARPQKFPIAPPVSGYTPLVSPANIAPTPGTMNDPAVKVQVFGEPRVVKGHPCTLWDSDDIARYRELLKTDKSLRDQLAAVRRRADQWMKSPQGIPGTHQGPDGKWLAPEDFPKNEPPFGKQERSCGANFRAMIDLGIVYALTGETKYAEYCRSMLLTYAANFPKWARPAKTRWRSAYDGRLGNQFLNDGLLLACMAWGYDLVHDLPSFTAEDRAQIDQFFRLAATPMFVLGAENRDYLSTKDNRSCLCAAAFLLAGYATEDQDLVDFALHGHAGTKLRPLATEGAGEPDPKELGGRPDLTPPPGGLLGVHFSDDCLLPDGLWVEGAPGYTLGIAGCGLFDAAESLWRHGVDMYRYRNGALKRLLDSGILLANPDPRMSVPALRDSGPFSLLDERGWLNNQIGSIYYCGYRRYHEEQYLPIIRNATPGLQLTIHGGPPLVKEDLPEASAASAVAAPAARSVNFYSIGYGILRLTEGKQTNGLSENRRGLSPFVESAQQKGTVPFAPRNTTSLLLQFSEEKDWPGHDHPSRLGIDFYTWGETLMPFPGIIFPYNDPLDAKWYRTTLANCVMVVDQDDQLDAVTRYSKYFGAPRPTAPQLVFAPAATLAMQRAYSSSIYPGTTLDRSLFLTPRYLADLFGGFCSVTRTYDLAWHFRGAVTPDLPLEAWTFPEPTPNGYNGLEKVRRAAADTAWAAAVTFQGKPLKFLAAAGPGTQVIAGEGHFDAYKEHPPTLIERRAGQNCVLFGNVLDVSADKEGYVKDVAQDGSLDAGYGLLKVHTTQGTDLCFAAYRPGTWKVGGLETDAVQAMATMDGSGVKALYLAGGTTLKIGGATIERSQPGLACVERLADGTYVVTNPSPTKATITVTLPALGGSKTCELEARGQWSSSRSP